MSGETRWSLVSLELTLDSAVEDSPHYRASLQRNEDQLDRLAGIMESLVKGSRHCLEIGTQLTEALGRLAPSMKRLAELEIFAEEKTPCCLSSMMDLVEAAFALHERLMKDLGQRLLIPLVQSVQEDLKELRDRKKSYEKARDRYENLVARFGALPRLKEFSLVREDMFQLFEGRTTYYGVSLDYLGRINRFKLGLDMFFVERCLGTIRQLDQFMGAMSAMVRAMQRPAAEVQKDLLEWQREAKQTAISLERGERDALERVRSLHGPDTPKPPSKGAEKAGYLFKKRQKSLGPSWRRVYVSIQEGTFRQFSPVSSSSTSSSHRGQVECTLDLHVLLCEIRAAEGAGVAPSTGGGSGGGAGGAAGGGGGGAGGGGGSSDRRHCFEIITSAKVHYYQAESDEEMREWIRVFENAKRLALRSSTGQIVPEGTAASESTISISAHAASDSIVASAPIVGNSQVSLGGSSTIDGAGGSSVTPSSRMPIGARIRYRRQPPLPPVPKGELVVASTVCLFEMDAPSVSVNFGRLFATMEGLYFQADTFNRQQTWAFLWKMVEGLTFTIQEITTTLTLTVGCATEQQQAGPKGGSGESAEPSPKTATEAGEATGAASSPSPPPVAAEGGRGSLLISVIIFNEDAATCDSLNILWRNARSEAPKGLHQLQLALRGGIGADAEQLTMVEPADSGARGLSLGGVSAEGASSCQCKSHLERKEIDMILPIEVDELFHLMMGLDSPVLKSVQHERAYKDIFISPWRVLGEAEREGGGRKRHGGLLAEALESRELKFTVPISHPLVKASETECHEEHFVLCKDVGHSYAVRQEARTPGVPYGDTFITLTLFCLTRYGPGRSRLRAFVGLQWIKNPLVKAMIRNGAFKGLSDYMATYKRVLWAEVRKAKPSDSLPINPAEPDDLPEETDSLLEGKSGTAAQNGSGALWLLPLPPWLLEMGSLMGEFLGDIRQRWRHNLEASGISRGTLRLWLGSLAMLVLSVFLHLRSRASSLTPTLHTNHPHDTLQYHSPFVPSGPADHGKSLHSNLLGSTARYRQLRGQVRRVARLLDLSQCLEEERIYVAWLADQLRRCYAGGEGGARHYRRCMILETEWSGILEGTSRCESLWRAEGQESLDDYLRGETPPDTA